MVSIVVMVVMVSVTIAVLMVGAGRKTLPIQGVSTGLSSDDLNYSRVIVFLQQKGLTPKNSTITSGVMNFKIGETSVTLGLGDDLDGRLQTLWRVWHEYQVKGKTLKTIDLRFSYPLVKY